MNCPKCNSQNLLDAKFCTNCGTQLPTITVTDTDQALKYIIPINNTGMSIFAFYFSFLSITLVLAPLSVLFGILTLKNLKNHPGKHGKGRAYFAIAFGGFFSLILLVVIIAAIAAKK